MKIGAITKSELRKLNHNLSELDRVSLKVRTILTVKSGYYTVDRTEKIDPETKMRYVTFTYVYKDDDLKIIYVRRGEESLYDRINDDSLLDYKNISVVISDKNEMYFNSEKGIYNSGELEKKFENLFQKCSKLIYYVDTVKEEIQLHDNLYMLSIIEQAFKLENDRCDCCEERLSFLSYYFGENTKSIFIDNRFIVSALSKQNSNEIIYEVRDLNKYDLDEQYFNLNGTLMCQYVVEGENARILSYQPGTWDYHFICSVRNAMEEKQKSK